MLYIIIIAIAQGANAQVQARVRESATCLRVLIFLSARVALARARRDDSQRQSYLLKSSELFVSFLRSIENSASLALRMLNKSF